MDIVDDEYMNRVYPDTQENEPEEYSTCAGCREIIYIGDENPLDVYGMCCHRDLDCVIKATEAVEINMTKERDD